MQLNEILSDNDLSEIPDYSLNLETSLSVVKTAIDDTTSDVLVVGGNFSGSVIINSPTLNDSNSFSISSDGISDLILFSIDFRPESGSPIRNKL